jgi:hypothetical protein
MTILVSAIRPCFPRGRRSSPPAAQAHPHGRTAPVVARPTGSSAGFDGRAWAPLPVASARDCQGRPGCCQSGPSAQVSRQRAGNLPIGAVLPSPVPFTGSLPLTAVSSQTGVDHSCPPCRDRDRTILWLGLEHMRHGLTEAIVGAMVSATCVVVSPSAWAEASMTRGSYSTIVPTEEA